MDEQGVQKERRNNIRIRSLSLTSYIPKKDGRQTYNISPGRTLDVSKAGVKIETHRALEKGTEVDMDIAIMDKIISVKGTVIHVTPLESGLFGIGVHFTSLKDEDLKVLNEGIKGENDVLSF